MAMLVSRLICVAALILEYDVEYFNIDKIITLSPICLALISCAAPMLIDGVKIQQCGIIFGLLTLYIGIKLLGTFGGHDYSLVNFHILGAICVGLLFLTPPAPHDIVPNTVPNTTQDIADSASDDVLIEIDDRIHNLTL
jgi:hypothetical protein